MSILGQEAITRRRFAAGSRGTDGRYSAGATTDTTILGSVQPANGDDMATLPEGERAKKGRRIYTTSEVRVADVEAGTPADQLLIDGVYWEARTVEQTRAVIPHYKVIALKVQEAE